MPIRSVIADDHPMCREAARMALGVADPSAVHHFAGSLEEARRLAGDADLMMLDLTLPDNRGLAGIAELHRDHPMLPILLITGSEQEGIDRRSRAAGCRGFVSKTAPISEMIDAIRTVIGGGLWFTPEALEPLPDADPELSRLSTLTSAQYRVLLAMRDGQLNKQIAFELGLSEITVKTHVKAILRKLDVLNRTQAVLMLRRAEEEDRFDLLPAPFTPRGDGAANADLP